MKIRGRMKIRELKVEVRRLKVEVRRLKIPSGIEVMAGREVLMMLAQMMRMISMHDMLFSEIWYDFRIMILTKFLTNLIIFSRYFLSVFSNFILFLQYNFHPILSIFFEVSGGNF
jgi:hypothetical protein